MKDRLDEQNSSNKRSAFHLAVVRLAQRILRTDSIRTMDNCYLQRSLHRRTTHGAGITRPMLQCEDHDGLSGYLPHGTESVGLQ